MKRHCTSLICQALFFLYLFFKCIAMHGQTYTMGPEEFMSWDEFIANYFDEFETATDDILNRNNQWQTETLDFLERLHQHPININTARREDFLRIPFLSEAQTDSIISYRERKRLLRSLGELQWISGIPYTTRCKLSLFAFAGDTLTIPTKIPQRLYKGKYEIITRTDLPLYKRVGDQDFTQEEITEHPSRFFVGRKFANTTRFRYQWKKDLAYGITLQKDAGEPFASYHNYPFDYTSFYFHYKSASHQHKYWIGDYNVNFGEGLLMSNSFFNGTMQLVENTALRQSNIRSHTSSDEINYFRGLAYSFKNNKHWETSVFASYRLLDGKVKNDTLTSFKTDGQHRTITEIGNRRNISNLVLGGRTEYSCNKWHIAANVYWSKYNKYIKFPPKDYNQHYLRGTSAAGISTDYAWKNKKWEMHGETALDRNIHIATSNTFHYKFSSKHTLLLQQRSFSTRFVSPFGNTPQANSQVQNEHGVILGLSSQPFDRLLLTAYADYFYHPNPTYRASQASNGFELFLQTKYAMTAHTYLIIRYKMKTKEQDVTGHKDIMEYVSNHRSRISGNYSSKRMNLNIAADFSIASRQTANNTFGWMISTRNHYRFNKRLSLHAFAAAFFTDDYASRLYAYEPQLQYAASFPTFAYHGTRFSAVAQWKFFKNGYAALRYGWIHYFNRDEIGSGAQKICSPNKSDLSIQLGCRF